MSFEQWTLDFLNNIVDFDFGILIQFVLFIVALFWFFVVAWVWNDAGERSTNPYFRFFSVVIVAPFNLLGLILYLVIRPKRTIEEIYWADLERRFLIYETAELGDCPRCGYQLRPGFNVCPQCAEEVKKQCETCQMMIDREWKYCPFCGNQHLLRRVSTDNGEISQEVMEKSVAEMKEQVIDVVEGGKTKYSHKHGIASAIGGSVIKSLKSISDIMGRKGSSSDTGSDSGYAAQRAFDRKKKKKKKKQRR